MWCGHPSASRCHFSPTFEGERFRKNLSFTPFSDLLQLNIFVGPLQRVRPRNGILALGLGLVVVLVVLPLRSEFIGEL